MLPSLQQVLEALPPPALEGGRRHARLDDVHAKLGGDRGALRRRLFRLIERGYVYSAKPGVFALTRRAVQLRSNGQTVKETLRHRVKKPAPRYPKERTIGVRVWEALRKLRKATTAQLLELAARDDEQGQTAATDALRLWVRFGLVAKRGTRGASVVTWFLIKDIGIHAPRRVQGGRLLWDPNAQAFLKEAAQ
jgi:hypothetical protein